MLWHRHPAVSTSASAPAEMEEEPDVRHALATQYWDALGLPAGERGRGVKVAVIDDFVDAHHEDFSKCLVVSLDFVDPIKVGIELYGLSDLRRMTSCVHQIRHGRNKGPYYKLLSSTVNALLEVRRYPDLAVSMVHSYPQYYASRLHGDYIQCVRAYVDGEKGTIDVDKLFADKGLDHFVCEGRKVHYRRIDKTETLERQQQMVHGTHVASIACGASTPFRTGLAPDSQLFALRVGCNVLWQGGLLCVDDALAYCRCVLQPDVINLSLGCEREDPANTAHIDAILRQGGIICAATGNSQVEESQGKSLRMEEIAYPAKTEGVFSVGAVSLSCAAGLPSLAPFSEIGNNIEWTAPGVAIKAAAAGTLSGSAVMSGTSMAAPFLAGLVALLISAMGERDPSMERSPERTRRIAYALSRSCRSVLLEEKQLSEGFDNRSGYGMVDVESAETFWQLAMECPSSFTIT